MTLQSIIDLFNKIPRDIVLLVVGSLIGWIISYAYYIKSVKDSKNAAEETKRINNLFLLGIESIGTIKYAKDSTGNITGVKIELKASPIRSIPIVSNAKLTFK